LETKQNKTKQKMMIRPRTRGATLGHDKAKKNSQKRSAFLASLLVIAAIWEVLYTTRKTVSQSLNRSLQQQMGDVTSTITGPAAAAAAMVPDLVARDASILRSGKSSHQTSVENLLSSAKEHHRNPNNPYLYIHVGPDFTGDLQDHLYEIKAHLHEDGYVVDAKLQTQFLDSECHDQLGQYRQQHANNKMNVKKSLRQLKCWKKVLKLLEPYRKAKQSILISNSTLGQRWQLFPGIGLAPLDFITMEETLGEHWNMEILVGYRRYHEWFIDVARSQAEERERLRLSQIKYTLFDEDIQDVPILFPGQVNTDGFVGKTAFVDSIIARYTHRDSGTTPSAIPITLLNSHKGPLVTTLACDILLNATSSCKAAKSLPKKSKKATVSKTQLSARPIQELDFYDILADQARKSQAYYVKKVSRHTARIGIRYLFEEVLRLPKSAMKLKCPDRRALSHFLHVSLQYERALVPHAQINESQFRSDFWQLVQQDAPQVLCLIDYRSTMHDRKVRQFIRDLPHGIPKEWLPSYHHEEQLVNGTNPLGPTKLITINSHTKARVTIMRQKH
jgi:hypothetical protein